MNSVLLLQRTLSRSIQALEPSRAVAMALGGVRGAKKKAAGSSTNGRGSAGRRLVSSSHSETPPGRANDEDVCFISASNATYFVFIGDQGLAKQICRYGIGPILPVTLSISRTCSIWTDGFSIGTCTTIRSGREHYHTATRLQVSPWRECWSGQGSYAVRVGGWLCSYDQTPHQQEMQCRAR
jgi:hypothetical protein